MKPLTALQQTILSVCAKGCVHSKMYRLQDLNRLAAKGLIKPFHNEDCGRRVVVWFELTNDGDLILSQFVGPRRAIPKVRACMDCGNALENNERFMCIYCSDLLNTETSFS